MSMVDHCEDRGSPPHRHMATISSARESTAHPQAVHATEATPLLPNAGEAAVPFFEPQDSLSASGEEINCKDQLKVTVLIFLLVIVTNTFGLLQESAQIQLYENIYCSQHYTGYPSPVPPADESLCKDESVQAKVALLLGWKRSLDFVPGKIFPWMK